jgi:hypothetical protein
MQSDEHDLPSVGGGGITNFPISVIKILPILKEVKIQIMKCKIKFHHLPLQLRENVPLNLSSGYVERMPISHKN